MMWTDILFLFIWIAGTAVASVIAFRLGQRNAEKSPVKESVGVLIVHADLPGGPEMYLSVEDLKKFFESSKDGWVAVDVVMLNSPSQ